MYIKYISLFITLLIGLVKAELPAVLNAKDYVVESLPDINTSNITQYAGLIPIRTNTFIFFWLFEQEEKKISNTEKLTIWLNGGPGCSSMDGVFMENGPYTFDENDHIIHNPYSWNKYSNMLYVEQPTGTGYSYTKNNDIPRNELAVGKDFNTFLAQFFRVFPQYKNAEIYIAGESFAGTYIPYIASNLINNPVDDKMINLQGIAIGNGWMDPLRQYQGYLKYSVDNGLLSGDYLTKTTNLVNKCTEEFKKSERIKNSVCEYILDTILEGSTANGQFCINMYDIRLRDNDSSGGCGLYSWPLTLNGMTNYLNRKDVIEALHVSSTPHSWTECTSRVSSALSGDNSPPSYTLFPELLKHIKITIFVGDKDLICNYNGIESMIDNLKWGDIQGFENEYVDWVVDGKVSGLYQSERNLTYIRMTNGSHMVAIDIPEESYVMFNSFIGVNKEVNPNLDDTLEFSSGEKKLSAIEPGSEFKMAKIITVSFISIGLIGGMVFFTVFKGQQNSSEYNEVEWHELNENEHGNDVIDIGLDDISLTDINNSETLYENDILNV
ncbi:alpha/beta-hydrolase [Neocallimastix sp. 'constans']|jgi:carboxypeptidase D